MIGTINIPRKFFAGTTTRVNDLWLTNGHWAILKTMLVATDQVVYATATTASRYLGIDVSEIRQESLDLLIPRVNLKRWEFTGKAIVGLDRKYGKCDKLEYEYVSKDGPELVYFDRAYIEMAYAKGKGVRCGALLGTGPKSAFIDEDRCFVLMPVVK